MSFVKSFERLCDEAGKAPTRVCIEIGLSDAIYSHWVKNDSVPRAKTIRKLAEYFGVSEDVVRGKESLETKNVSVFETDTMDRLMIKSFKLLNDDNKEYIYNLCQELLKKQESKDQVKEGKCCVL